MKSKIALLALVLTLGASVSAAAQEHPDVVYQKALLARSLSAEDKDICDKRAGAGNAAAHDACRVTRLFLIDINAGHDKGVPPMAHIKYAVDKEEKGKILDRL